MASGPRHVLLERERELSALDAAVRAAPSGAGAVVSVEGPAGIGKSSLLDAAAGVAERTGIRVLRARGAELERQFAFGVTRQLFEATLGRLGQEAREAVYAGPAAGAAWVLASGEEPTSSDAFGPVHALYWLTANLAAHEPLVLIVDDAQWADEPSLRFLGYLARRLEGVPAALMLGLRTGEHPTDEEILASLLEAAKPLQPAPLSLSAAGEIAGAHVAGAEASFVAACHGATQGNPFLLTTLLQAAVADGIPGTSAGAARVIESGAHSARRAVSLRLRRLLPVAAPIARAVAVLGAGAELRHVAALTSLDASAVARGVDALVDADVLLPGRPLAFAHPLVHAAVYADIPRAERSLSHAEAARLLRADGAQAEQVAAQLLEADPAGETWAVEALLAAAAGALARGAPEPAVGYLRRALAEPAPHDRRAEVLRELATAEGQLGDPVAVDRYREALALSVDGGERAVIALSLRDALVREDRAADAVDMLAGLLGDPETPAARRRDLEIGMLAAAQLDPAGAGVLAERLPTLRRQALGGEVEDPYALAVIALAMGFADARAQEVAPLARRALVPQAAEDPAAWHRIFVPGCMALIVAEDLPHARDTLDRTVVDAERRGLLSHFVMASVLRAWTFLRLGDLPAAEADARVAIDAIGLGRFEWWRPLGVALLAQILTERGQVEEAEACIGGETDPAERRSLHHTHLLFARGRVRHMARGCGDGLDDLLMAGARYLGHLASSPGVASWRSDAALECRAAGRAEQAQALAREEVALARAAGTARAEGVALRAAGLVEGGDAGADLLQEAVEVLSRAGSPLELARANVDLGAALRRGRRRADSREPLRLGLDLAHRCGAGALVERARAELAATGARPRRDMVTGRDALTAAERRVAELVAGGRSNREAAQALFVTAKTIDNHLSQIYRKLGIHSRRELAAALEAEARS